MSLLSDIFVASADTVQQYDGSDNAAFVARLESKNLTDLSLGLLWALLEDKEWDMERHEFELLRMPEEEEPLLAQFPPVFVGLLQQLKDHAVEQLAVSWASSEEVQWEPEDAAQFIRDLASLAKKVSGDLGLYLWVSL